MILGYAIYLRTHRETGKQYGGCCWWTNPNQIAERACKRRWKREDNEGIRGLFGGFNSEIILSEKRTDIPDISEGLYRIRIAVDEDAVINKIPSSLRLNIVSPLIQNQKGLMNDTMSAIGGCKGAATCKKLGVGIFGMSLEKRRAVRKLQPIEVLRAVGNKHKENGTSIFAPGINTKGGFRAKEKGVGIHDPRNKGKGGRTNVASGQVQELGRIYGRISVENGQLDAARKSTTHEQRVSWGYEGALRKFLKTVAWG